MSRKNHSFGISFNDNDGSVGWFVDPATCDDITRHIKIFGKWRTRWIFFKQFYRALFWAEFYVHHEVKDAKRWVVRPAIPE